MLASLCVCGQVHHAMPKGFGTRANASKQTTGGGAAYIWQAIMDKDKVKLRSWTTATMERGNWDPPSLILVCLTPLPSSACLRLLGCVCSPAFARQVEVRELGAAAYGAFMQLVHERESEDDYYREAIDEVDRNFERSAMHIDKSKVWP